MEHLTMAYIQIGIIIYEEVTWINQYLQKQHAFTKMHYYGMEWQILKLIGMVKQSEHESSKLITNEMKMLKPIK